MKAKKQLKCGRCGAELVGDPEDHYLPDGCVGTPGTSARVCAVCGRPWLDGKCSGGFINHKPDFEISN